MATGIARMTLDRWRGRGGYRGWLVSRWDIWQIRRAVRRIVPMPSFPRGRFSRDDWRYLMLTGRGPPAGGAFVLAVASAMGKAPLWAAVVVLALGLLVQAIPVR